MSSEQAEEDPFDVFGSDDENENNNDDETDKDVVVSTAQSSTLDIENSAGEETATSKTTTSRRLIQRDPSCGPLVFHHGTEQALLQFVERGMSKIPNEKNTTAAALASRDTQGDDSTSGRRLEQQSSASLDEHQVVEARPTKRERVIQLVDEFCFSRHWMMNIGPEKGDMLDRFLIESLERHGTAQVSDSNNKPFSLVEVGTYCGYSTIRIIHTILQWQQEQQQKQTNNMDFHIFTVDINPQTMAIARQLVSLAGLDSYVTFLLLPEKKDSSSNNDKDADDDFALSKTLQSALQDHGYPEQASFVFLDHDKYIYLSDLKQLEASKIICAQTSVAADNVVFHGLDDYRQHMQTLASQGIVETRLEMGHLEYIISAVNEDDDGDENKDDVFLPGTTTVRSRAIPGNRQRHLQTNTDFRDGLELTYYIKDP